MQGPIRKGFPETAMVVRDYLLSFPNMYSQDATGDLLQIVGTAACIDWKNLRTIDSLIVASGLFNSVDLFISNDDHFKKSLPQDMLLSFD